MAAPKSRARPHAWVTDDHISNPQGPYTHAPIDTTIPTKTILLEGLIYNAVISIEIGPGSFLIHEDIKRIVREAIREEFPRSRITITSLPEFDSSGRIECKQVRVAVDSPGPPRILSRLAFRMTHVYENRHEPFHAILNNTKKQKETPAGKRRIKIIRKET